MELSSKKQIQFYIKMDASKMMIESERYNYPEDPDWDDELEEEEIDGYEF